MSQKKMTFSQKFQKAKSSGSFSAALMLAPAVFFLCLCSIYPFIWIFRYVACDYNGFKSTFTGWKNFERMLNDPYFTVEELSAIALGYTKLLEESAHLLNDLKSVVNENGLSMSDKDRMDIIDKCYSEMLQYRGLVQYYTNKNIGVSYLRAKKQNDVDRVMSLYGSPSERYW